ncbi:MAG TPA: M48 family metallopeptidase [Thermoanaerobaculia bacterium]|nr:M48 family metallopeptidase [Thermoanaerobaculia bacterium]
MRRLLFALAAAAVVVTAVAVIGAPASRPQSSDVPSGDRSQRFEVRVTPEMLRHSRIDESIYFGGTLYSIATLLLLLATGASAKLRELAQRMVRRRFLASMLYILFFAVAIAVLDFPLTYYADFFVPHQFDLSNQSFGSWLLDQTKAFAVTVAILAPLGALALRGIARFKQWWRILWLASIPLSVFFIVIAPVFLDPIFNKFTKLQDPVLEQALLDEASRAGIEGSRVFQADKSKQTKTMNAYVTGLGPTKRIVIWDTLLAKMTREEVLAVMAHEMGHYVLNHVWKGLAFSIVVSFLSFFVGQHVYDRGIARWGAKWEIREPGDPAAVPWLLIVAAAIGFFLTPVTSAFSRHVEHQADVFGLQLTHFNEPMASAFKKLAEDAKYNPAPNRFVELWHYSHPSTNERIRYALEYGK